MVNPVDNNELMLLLRKYLSGAASPQEAAFVEQYYDWFEKEPDVTGQLTTEEIDKLSLQMKAVIDERITPAKVIGMNRRRSWWIGTAAAVLVLISVAAFYLLQKPADKKMEITGNENPYKNDVLPGGNKATLTLADGSVIILDSVKNGRLADQGNTTVLKVNEGQLAYNTDYGDAKEVAYNTITTPRGGQYRVVLPEGSKVWLNAASSLRFPTDFRGAERRVEVTGETYFEVAHDATKPFRVDIAGKGEVEVIGTHFNVNAYEDEGAAAITLIEGSVKLKRNNDEQILQPAQQGIIEPAASIRVADGIDTEKVVAWKNGLFQFEKEDIEAIMRQVSRWYNVEIKYEGKVQGNFYATIERNVPVSELLRLLSLTEGVHFKIDGSVIIVTP